MTDAPRPGQPVSLAPGLRCILAPNPSAMTLWGTNTYLLGETEIAVIDPGPDDPRHLAAIRAALAPGQHISHIFVTHAHLDHSPAARPHARATGAPVLAFGGPAAGRSALMARLAAEGLTCGGEGVDAEFAPDICLADGAVVTGAGWQLQALHTPGHFCNHLCFLWAGGAFTGDHVMSWASTLISPPDGDLNDYMTSLDRLAAAHPPRLFPGHGAPVAAPAARIADLAAHRRARTAQILAVLHDGPANAATLAQRLYTDTPAPLLPAATRNILAHLIDIASQKVAISEGIPSADTLFRHL